MTSPDTSCPGSAVPDSALHTEAGRAALAAAMAEAEPSSLAAATRLRRDFAPELAAEALGQAQLRRRARTKFGERADQLFLTPDALEQATRPVVARWRARRLAAAGITRVVDLGCGIGTDAMACAEQGLDVVAVELDPTTAEHARANLTAVGVPSQQVLTGDAVALAPSLLSGAGPQTCVFLDPSRRTETGRTWRVDAFTPPWEFVLDTLKASHSTVVKLGPGVPRNILPEGIEALWVADGHDVVECSLWATPDARPVHGAVLLNPPHTGGGAVPDQTEDGLRVDHLATEPLPVGPLGRYLLEPHGAVIRAGALREVSPDARLLDAQVAYLTTDEPVTSAFVTCFEVLEVLDFNPKLLKAWVREHRVGTLEIKKRAIDVDPAELRRRLAPKGPNSATLVLARTTDGTRALVARRWSSSETGCDPAGTRLE